MSQHMQTIGRKHKIRVSSSVGVVEAPLPDDFGLTIGSSYTTLFDLGSLNGVLSKGAAILSVSQKVGVSMKRMFSNPEPSEISFDMEFVAMNDAYSEVVMPIKTMLLMAAPSHVSASEGANSIKEMADSAGELTETTKGGILGAIADQANSLAGEVSSFFSDAVNQPEAVSSAQKAMDLIGFIKGPDKANIYFGNIFSLQDAYISSVSFRMSNVLDSRGYPMKGGCSVTVVLEDTPLKHSVNEWFN